MFISKCTNYIYIICDAEVGANMQPDYMVRYQFDEASGDISTDEETIIIGFSTQEKKGLLMLIRNDDTEKPEYISVEMNNNGKLRVTMVSSGLQW